MTRAGIRPEIEAILPDRMRGRPVTEKGYPVPWFASKPDGVTYDLRVIDARKVVRAVKEHRCWICGEPLGRHLSFVIGPMCAVNRISSEPPQHRECAIFAAKACPFLTLPKAQRRDHNYPEGYLEPDGEHLAHNPGACAVWCTMGCHVFRGPKGGVMFGLGEPVEIWWFAQGRPATREEVVEAMNLGLPKLREAALQDGGDADVRLAELVSQAMTLLPTGPGPVTASAGV